MTSELQWVAFRVGEQTYGVPIAAVKEIVRAPEITPVPQAADYVAGVTNLGGRIIPVIDLRKKLQVGHKAQSTRHEVQGSRLAPDTRPLTPDTRKARVLVVTVEARQIGMLVDEASEVLKIAATEIEAGPKVFGDESDSYVTGIAKYQGRLIVLLDACNLLNRDTGLGNRDSEPRLPNLESQNRNAPGPRP